MAIACDVIIAAENAQFGQPEIKLGFFPPYAVVRLPELVGPARAIEICTTGKRYTGAEAKEMGLAESVNHTTTAPPPAVTSPTTSHEPAIT